MKPANNLRGRKAIVFIDGKARLVTVITHTRGPRWLVEGRELPKWCERFSGRRRTVVDRDEMTLIEPIEI